MKIEASKNHQVDKKESKNVFKTETSVFNTSNPLKTVAPAQSPSAFAKILEETRRENEKDNTQTAKTDSAEHDSKAEKSERDERIENRLDEKKELEEKDSRSGDGDAQQNADDHNSPAAALAALQSPVSSASPTAAAPAARSILHVADLERIVATIRTETFQNQKQVTIALKNSVLQGLQIKLSIGEDGKLKAEFLATGKQIKSQLEKRKKELSEILHNRSSLFSDIEITSQE